MGGLQRSPAVWLWTSLSSRTRGPGRGGLHLCASLAVASHTWLLPGPRGPEHVVLTNADVRGHRWLWLPYWAPPVRSLPASGNLEENLSRQRHEPLSPEELERSQCRGAGWTGGEGWASGLDSSSWAPEQAGHGFYSACRTCTGWYLASNTSSLAHFLDPSGSCPLLPPGQRVYARHPAATVLRELR